MICCEPGPGGVPPTSSDTGDVHRTNMGGLMSAISNCLCFRARPIEQRQPEGDFNPAVGGLGQHGYMNPLGRMSIRRPSPADLERASIIHIKD
ncbi:g4603 [Coccomyxa elongata]